jgi:phosphate acetyltransferase
MSCSDDQTNRPAERHQRAMEAPVELTEPGVFIENRTFARLPGPGTVYLEQTLRFRHPVRIGDTITVSVTAAAAAKDRERQRISFDCVNQRGEAVIDGTAKVIAPAGKIRRPPAALPAVRLYEHGVLFGAICFLVHLQAL